MLYHQKVYKNWFCAAEEEPLVKGEYVARDAGMAKSAFSHVSAPEQWSSMEAWGTFVPGGHWVCLETFLAVTACGVAPQASSGWRPGLLHLQPPAPWEAPQHRVLLTWVTAVPHWEILPWRPPGEMDFKETSIERIRRLFCSDLHGCLCPRAALGQRSDCTARLLSLFLSGTLCPRSPCTAPMQWVMRPAYSGTPGAWGVLARGAAAAKSLQLRPTLCDPRDGSPSGSPVLGFSRQEHWSGLPFPSPMHESEKWKWSRLVVSDS